jgi:hypothetical protein
MNIKRYVCGALVFLCGSLFSIAQAETVKTMEQKCECPCKKHHSCHCKHHHHHHKHHDCGCKK